jgi:tripartite-type tricarboxylate transporter receptor subunit TctC
LVAPAGTPAETIARLNADTVRGMTQADVRERLAGQGLFVKTGSPADLAALMQSELVKWAKVVKAANLKVE